MGTAEPSGNAAVTGPAVRLTCCCAKAAPLASSRTEAASPDLVRSDLKVLNRIAILLVLVRFVDHEFARIDEHHHQHAAGEDVVGGDLAFVMRVPHESKACFAAGRVRDRAPPRRA